MIYGIDVSTSIIGVASFRNDGTFVRADHCDLRETEGLFEKADVFRQWVADFSPQAGMFRDDENFVFIEERLGGFAAGRTSAQVLMKLGAFNAICTYIMRRHEHSTRKHLDVIHLHPSSWKSIMKKEGLIIPKGSDKKKEITLDFVRRTCHDFNECIVLSGMFNRNGNPYPYCYDMADAYCLGRSGFKKLCNERESFKRLGTPSETKVGRKVKKQSSSARTQGAATEPTTSES